MADQPTTPSGSRWEPTSDEATSTDPSETAIDAQADAPVHAPPIAPSATDAYGIPATETLPDPAGDERRARLRTRSVLAGAATALALGGGLVGFVIGHSTAGDGATGFRPANFSGQQPGGQFGDGQQQGPPSFGDRDGDGGWGQPPQGSNGSSSDGTSSSSAGTSTTGT
jgi:hypothetical protein